MTPERILVTGAGGFVGAHLLPQLRAAFPAAALILCDRRPGMLALDVTDTAATEAVIAETRPDACIHLAALAAVPAANQDPDRAWRVNLHGTLNVARAVRRHAPACRFLFVSSADIYGASFRAGVALDETALPAPLNNYSASKAAADLVIGALAAEGLLAVRLRPFNHTGPGQSPAFVVPAFARQVARIAASLQEPRLQVGALDSRRDFLDVRDVCAAYVACLHHAERLEPGVILNLASGQERRIGDILDSLLRLAGVSARIETAPALLRPTDIPSARGDCTRARHLLDWQPRHTWEETLSTVLADWQQRVRAQAAASHD
jgi:GDP-4-dehydro-6-deoxy-D-mannose reductase